MKKQTLLFLVGSLAMAAASQAALIVNFNPAITALTGTNVSVTATGANVDSTLAADSVLTRGAGLTATSANGRFISTSANQTSLANALSGNDYFTFTITPAAGATLDYGDITFTLQSSGTGATDYAFFSSIGGFTAANVIQSGNRAAPSTTALTVSDATLGSTYDAVTAPTEFRVYVFGGSAAGGTTSVNALQINAVPEPSTYGMLMGATGLLVWVVRRKHSKLRLLA